MEDRTEGKIQPLLVTVKQAAKLLNVSPRKIHDLRSQEGLPFIKLGRSVRFRVDQLCSWLDRKAQQMQGWAF